MYLTGGFVALMALSAVAVAVFQWEWTAGVWFAVALVVAVVDVLLAPRVSSLEFTRPDQRAVRRDESTELVLVAHNRGRRAARVRVRDAWQPSAGATDEAVRHSFRLAAGDQIRLVTPARPFRRGDLMSDHVAVRVCGPLWLAGRQKTLPGMGKISVLPPFRSRKHLPGLLRRLKWVEGQVATRLRGQGTEFDSLREYVFGDDVRSIDWRATARVGTTIVRTWRPEQDRSIAVVLDTSRLSAVRTGDEPRLDASLESTLLLSSVANAAHDRVDVLALDAYVRASVTGVGRTMTVRELHRALASVHATSLEMDWERAAAEINQRCKRHSFVVLLTALDSSAIHTSLVRVAASLAGRHQVLVGAVQDTEVMALTGTDASSLAAHDPARAGANGALSSGTLDQGRTAGAFGGVPVVTGGGGVPGSVGAGPVGAMPHSGGQGLADPSLRKKPWTGDEADPFAAAAAYRALFDMDAMVVELTRAGVDCVTANPADLPKAISERYLRLKLLGLL